jgi:hypothetical protein
MASFPETSIGAPEYINIYKKTVDTGIIPVVFKLSHTVMQTNNLTISSSLGLGEYFVFQAIKENSKLIVPHDSGLQKAGDQILSNSQSFVNTITQKINLACDFEYAMKGFLFNFGLNIGYLMPFNSITENTESRSNDINNTTAIYSLYKRGYESGGVTYGLGLAIKCKY